MLSKGRRQFCPCVRMHLTPKHVVPLAFAAGTSSNAPYVDLDAKTTDEQRELGGATLPLWSPADITSKDNRDTILADGGAVDNLAMLPLFRRGVKNVICHIAGTTSVNDADFASAAWWPSLFGCAKSAPSAVGVDNLNMRTKVFHSEPFKTLISVAACVRADAGGAAQ